MKASRIPTIILAILLGGLAGQVQGQDLVVRGLCYSPFRDGQSPVTGVYPTRKQMMEDLRLLRHHTTAIRFYGLSGTQALIPKLARANGLQCYVGAWISSNVVANADELAVLKKIARSRQAAGVVVGNEVLPEESRTGTLSATQLVQYISEVKKESKVPVGYADTYAQWLSHPEVAGAVDFLFVHIHPYWDSVDAATAADYVRQRWVEVAAAYPGKQVIVAETGWPSAGPANGAAVPSPENQRAFLEAFIPRALAEGIPYFLFEAFDEAWKSESGGVEVEGHWGVFQSNRQVKTELGRFFTNPPPLLDITRPAKRGAGAESWGTIGGCVCGIQKAERKNMAVVVYAGTDKWYVQPTTSRPLTRVQSSFKWTTSTHLGDNYLALLVRMPYEPAPTLDAVPAAGGNVLAVSRVAAQVK